MDPGLLSSGLPRAARSRSSGGAQPRGRGPGSLRQSLAALEPLRSPYAIRVCGENALWQGLIVRREGPRRGRRVTSVMSSPSTSVVLPVMNEQDNLEPLHARLTATFKQLDRPYEIIYVDDGS